MFKFKPIKDVQNREYGFALRFFGIDISVITCWWINSWSLGFFNLFTGIIGITVQLLFLSVFVGRENSLYE